MYVEVISTVPDSITITMSIACHQRNRTINLIFMLCGSFVFFLIIKVLFSRVISVKKKNGKIPKRIHKSEREKMKRENLNELFLALANSLGEV